MSSTHFEEHDGLDRLSSDELEEQAFGPDPTRKRTRRGGPRRWKRRPKPAPSTLPAVASPATPASVRPVVTKFCYACGDEIAARAAVCPRCATRQPEVPDRAGRAKDKGTATLLALVFGGVGAHRFYLGQTRWGIAMLLFCWTFIPVGIGIVDFVRYVQMSDRRFAERYDGASRTLLPPPREQLMIARPVRAAVADDPAPDEAEAGDAGSGEIEAR